MIRVYTFLALVGLRRLTVYCALENLRMRKLKLRLFISKDDSGHDTYELIISMIYVITQNERTSQTDLSAKTYVLEDKLTK